MLEMVDLLVRREGYSHAGFVDVEAGPRLVVEETVKFDERHD